MVIGTKSSSPSWPAKPHREVYPVSNRKLNTTMYDTVVLIVTWVLTVTILGGVLMGCFLLLRWLVSLL